MKSPLPACRASARASHPPAVADLEKEFVEALAGQAFRLRFQPQFCARVGRVVGAEALARWPHPRHGELPASTLFSIAQRAGKAIELSRRLIALALAEAALWPAKFRIAINISPEQLMQREFAEEIDGVARLAGIAPARVTLEITEDALLEDLDRAGDVLSRLRRKGFRIALDDFGAGFCNFAYLKRLPLDELKIDSSLVRGVGSEPRDDAIFRAMVMLGRALALSVVAEGVETEAQRRVVESEGCDIWQGFLGAAPQRSDDLGFAEG